MTAKIPVYIKYFFILASIVLTLYIIIIGQFIFKPLIAALVIAILLKPIASWLEKLTHSRIASVTITVFFLLILVGLLLLFIFSQAQNIIDDSKTLAQGFSVLLDNSQSWLKKVFGISLDDPISLLKKHAFEFVKNISGFLPGILITTADFFAELILFIIAVCFFLFYRHFLVRFLFKVTDASLHPKMEKILSAIQLILKKYIFGIFLVILTTSTLNTIGLLILGIKHAVFFGTAAGILTIIPYIGIIAGSLLPILFTLTTTASLWYPLGIILIFGLVQFLEGNFITPKLIGHQISLNPLASLIALLVAGKFFGILGIILALPCMAIIKVIADHVKPLKAYGYLIGNEE